MSAKRASSKALKAIRAPAPPPTNWERLRRDPRMGEAACVILPLRAARRPLQLIAVTVTDGQVRTTA